MGEWQEKMDFSRIIFSGHAVQRMFSRGISSDEVIDVIHKGEKFVEYPDDVPYPSCIVLGFVRDMPVHVVLGIDRENETGIVITAYVPNPTLWGKDFKTRRKR